MRPQTESDREFLAALYASTRADELAVLPWTPQQKAEFLHSQFEAQNYHYALHYGDADFLVLERGGERIGRLYLHRAGDDLCVIDIALLPEHRGAGLGTALMHEVLAIAVDENRSVSLHVEIDNPVQRLYAKLGFVWQGRYGVYDFMVWRAPASAQVKMAS